MIKHRMLKEGEVIRKGDQHNYRKGIPNWDWKNTINPGASIGSREIGHYRRSVGVREHTSAPKATISKTNPESEMKLAIDKVSAQLDRLESMIRTLVPTPSPKQESKTEEVKSPGSPKYRMLREGEILRVGDQFHFFEDGIWYNTAEVGLRVSNFMDGKYRRKVQQYRFLKEGEIKTKNTQGKSRFMAHWIKTVDIGTPVLNSQVGLYRVPIK